MVTAIYVSSVPADPPTFVKGHQADICLKKNLWTGELDVGWKIAELSPNEPLPTEGCKTYDYVIMDNREKKERHKLKGAEITVRPGKPNFIEFLSYSKEEYPLLENAVKELLDK